MTEQSYRVASLVDLVAGSVLGCGGTLANAFAGVLCLVCCRQYGEYCSGCVGSLLLFASLLAAAPVPWMLSDAELAAFLGGKSAMLVPQGAGQSSRLNVLDGIHCVEGCLDVGCLVGLWFLGYGIYGIGRWRFKGRKRGKGRFCKEG